VLVSLIWFERLVVAVIIWGCVLLALESPVVQTLAPLSLLVQNTIVTAIFAGEMLLRVCASGLMLHPGAYLRSAWNILDAIIVAVGVLDLAIVYPVVLGTVQPESAPPNAVVVLRALRALRPLRAVNKFEGLRIIAIAFSKAIKPSLAVMGLTVLFYALFAVTFQTTLGGQLHACYECPIDNDAAACVRRYDLATPNCSLQGLSPQDPEAPYCPPEFACQGPGPSNGTEWRWLNPGYGSVTLRSNAVGGAASFDSFGQAWVTLFEISTTEMWVVPAWASSDAVGVGRQPVRGSYDVITLAFVAFG
jgi:hypothetical protein